ncbi:uncharacterized protein PFL1_04124 [Pseudozyma flocculosa PF-1]|uniref:Uncharacterized protein n=2 Tax=Pseudozyma flocculosa TaxID=84751 RepID=A0A5C3ETP8_9BASI|nr:uncharacterized protein PFL1_04124 [Pseudozyma flocculosa PF-1]EPQ28297.1 hypothetical protein PFL1_04124 [Pseudozyma flocculosa PF-1]SPO35442.1 uncharacterized protein PSFLO_00913 [Pseudozyma flocculosa]
MALNLDDLIGSMQHGFHAGDRGNDLNEIRENLKMTLGQQALGPGHSDASQSSNSSRRPPNARWDNRAYPPPHSSLDGDVAMLSGSVEAGGSRGQSGQTWQSYAQQQSGSNFGRSPMSMSNDQGGGGSGFDARFLNSQSSPPVGFGGPGSVGSQGSSTSSYGFGGFAQAPANTPQQTPVESSALARQLQAELERARDQQGSNRIAEADDERAEPDWTGQYQRQSASFSPPAQFPASDAASGGGSSSGYSLQFGTGGEQADRSSLTPRKLVNGFQPTNSNGSGVDSQGSGLSSPQYGGGQSIGAGQ